jgi:SIR2-like domain
LHGSINWRSEGTTVTRYGADQYRDATGEPLLVFGAQNKLREDEPFLDLMWQCRTELDASDHLIVIGYSFRDVHINAFLESWLRRRESAQVTIVVHGMTIRHAI